MIPRACAVRVPSPCAARIVLAAAAAAALGAGACVRDHAFLYTWDQRAVVCSEAVDDLSQGDTSDFVDDTFSLAANRAAVVTLHAHVPGRTISVDWLEQVLRRADDHGLAYVTYRDLADGPARAGLALAFDDQAIDAWWSIRDQLARHHARVTFFITRWASAWDDDGKAQLAALAADGHDVQPHTTSHLHARDYVRDHGLDAYLADEIDPSIAAMRAAGYPPVALAFPFGETTPEITAAVLTRIPQVRVSPGSCPY